MVIGGKNSFRRVGEFGVGGRKDKVGRSSEDGGTVWVKGSEVDVEGL